MYILGTNLINDKEYFLEENYIDHINIIKSKFIKKKISYFPHPREQMSKKFKQLLKKMGIKIIISNLPIELYLKSLSNIPKNFISFYSSSYIVLKIIFQNSLSLFFYNIVREH